MLAESANVMEFLIFIYLSGQNFHSSYSRVAEDEISSS